MEIVTDEKTIVNHLYNETIKRGYKKGVFIDRQPAYNGAGQVYEMDKEFEKIEYSLHLYPEYNQVGNISAGGFGICVIGNSELRWAPIVTHPKFKFGDYDVIVFGNSVRVGKETVSKNDILALQQWINHISPIKEYTPEIKIIKIGCMEGNLNDLSKVCEYIRSKK